MGVLHSLRRRLSPLGWPVSAALARARQNSRRPTRFAGAWPDRAAALASLPPEARRGYDDPSIAEVSFDYMSQVQDSDHSVLFWLHRILKPGDRVLDAGGHMGTKYLAWRDQLPLDQVQWVVQDLPGIVAAARDARRLGRLPSALEFVTTPEGAKPDLLLASGLLQYLDRPFGAYLAELAAPPRHVILNKVATRRGADLVTLERIGGARVPYQIRERAGFEAELEAAGYDIKDSWDLPMLANVIPTHPWLGASLSRGYLLEHRTARAAADNDAPGN